MWSIFARIVVVAIVVLFLSTGAMLGQTKIPTADVTLAADGLSAPTTLPEGLVAVNFRNTSEGPFIGVLLRLNDGVTLDDLLASMAGNPMGMLPLVSLRGGPGVMPGQARSVTYNLDPGEYVLANFAGEKPQTASITVADEIDVKHEQPRADFNLALVDFGYGLPSTIPAGEKLWRIENTGQQWHEVAIAPVKPGTTIVDVKAMLAKGESAGLQQLPLLMPMDGGKVVWMTIDLQPGTYAIICNLPDLKNMNNMHPHYELGMIQVITVANTVSYTGADGKFALDYPAELSVVRPDLARELGLPFLSVGFADSEATLNASTKAQAIPPGGWGLAIMFIPSFFFTEMGMPADAPLMDLAKVFAPQPGNAEGTKSISTDEIMLADGRSAVRGQSVGTTEDSLTIFFEVADGVYALAALVSAPSGRTEAMADALMTTVNSVVFTGSLEDLKAGMGSK